MHATSYKTLSDKERNELLAKSGKESYKYSGHSFRQMKGVGKQVCNNCGLIALRNKATDWCIDKGCNYEDHPQYKQAMKRLTKSKI